jgi:hypothetical protein
VLGEQWRRREPRQVLDGIDQAPTGFELGSAPVALAEVRLEGGHAKARLPV